MARVLLAEDDPAIAEPLSRALAREGYEVEVTPTGPQAVDRAEEFDLLVVDLSLPGISGQEVARQVRARGASVPILVLSGRADEIDELGAIGSSADDYVTKPFRLAELLARVRNLIRLGEAGTANGERLVAQDLTIDPRARKALRGDQELHLTHKEFDLLVALVRQAGTLVPQEDLMRYLWGNDPQGSPKTLETHVSWLRRKLGDDAAEPRYISTDPGVGFRFELGG